MCDSTWWWCALTCAPARHRSHDHHVHLLLKPSCAAVSVCFFFSSGYVVISRCRRFLISQVQAVSLVPCTAHGGRAGRRAQQHPWNHVASETTAVSLFCLCAVVFALNDAFCHHKAQQSCFSAFCVMHLKLVFGLKKKNQNRNCPVHLKPLLKKYLRGE